MVTSKVNFPVLLAESFWGVSTVKVGSLIPGVPPQRANSKKIAAIKTQMPAIQGHLFFIKFFMEKLL